MCVRRRDVRVRTLVDGWGDGTRCLGVRRDTVVGHPMAPRTDPTPPGPGDPPRVSLRLLFKPGYVGGRGRCPSPVLGWWDGKVGADERGADL